MKILRRDVVLSAVLLAILAATLAGGVHIMGSTVERLLHRDAEAAGRGWATYLADNLDDLQAIVAGEPPSAESLVFFGQAQAIGQVFRYKIFSPDGLLRLVSDDLPRAGGPGQSIDDHNPTAAAVLRTGEPAIEAKDGTQKPDRPDFYAEAYVPVSQDGRRVGIVEVYVDQSEKRELFRSQVFSAALGLAGLTLLAFAVPAGALYWRSREKSRAEEAVRFLSRHDGLTGLSNRASFMDGLDGALGDTGSAAGIALHCLDLDDFKEVNDALGQRAADEVLLAVANRLRAVVGEAGTVARLGGDEFAVAQRPGGTPPSPELLAARLLQTFAAPFAAGGREIELGASLGVAVAPAEAVTAAQLYKCASIALQRAKADGGGRHVLFRPEMDSELQARREIERRIRQAVAEDGFELHFQPLCRASDRRLAGFEALLRLPGGTGETMSPSDFVPVAESIGLIGRIGAWVLRHACETAVCWPDELTVAVNLSPDQFRAGDIVELVRRTLAETGLAPARLELEITEGMLLADTDNVLAQLAELKALGVALAMDDFGTGYSSLSYLWKFRFDTLKIDRSFVGAIDGAEAGNVTSIVSTIAALGRSLDMQITAEGVESETQAAFLRAAGCDRLQGFHLGRPMPITEVAAAIIADGRAALAAAAGEDDRSRAAGS